MRTGDIWFGGKKLTTLDAVPPAIREGLKTWRGRKGIHPGLMLVPSTVGCAKPLRRCVPQEVENAGFLVERRKKSNFHSLDRVSMNQVLVAKCQVPVLIAKG